MSIKKQLSKISPISACIIVLFAAAMSYFIFGAFAASGTATLYTSPGGTQAVTTGQSFAVNVRISSGASVPVTGASVYLSYPTDKLQLLGQSYAGSPYSTQLIETNSGGVLRMDRAAFPAIAGGDQLFAQVTFKALAAGSAPISFTNSSIITSGEDDSNILAAKNGVTYSISAPATPPPVTPPAGGGSSGGTSSGSSSSGAPASGTKSSTSTAAKSSTTAGSSTPAAASTGGTPVTTTNPDGSITTTTDESGLTDSTSSSVTITVLDSDNKPVEGASVTLNGQTAKTGEDGVAHFEGVPAGNQAVRISYNGKKTDKTVHVKGASTKAAPETFKVSISRNKFNPVILLLPLVLLAAAGVLFLRPWKGHFAVAGVGAEDAENIVTSDRLFIETPTTTTKQAPGSVVAPGGESKPPAEPATPTPAEPDTTIKPDEPPKS